MQRVFASAKCIGDSNLTNFVDRHSAQTSVAMLLLDCFTLLFLDDRVMVAFGSLKIIREARVVQGV